MQIACYLGVLIILPHPNKASYPLSRMPRDKTINLHVFVCDPVGFSIM